MVLCGQSQSPLTGENSPDTLEKDIEWLAELIIEYHIECSSIE